MSGQPARTAGESGGALRLGVLASGRGSNLRNLNDRGCHVVAVATNRPSCGAAAIAREAGIPLGEFSQKRFDSVEARDAAVVEFFRAHGVELVVQAGYDRILAPVFTAAYRDRIINLHPSLLPAFGGTMEAIREALEHGVKVTGCTVHLVTDALDGGPILLQQAVPVLDHDTLEELTQRVHAAEHDLLPQAIRLMEERIRATTRTAVG